MLFSSFGFYLDDSGSIWMILVPNGTSSLPKVKFRLPFGRIGFQTEPKTSKSKFQPSVWKQWVIMVQPTVTRASPETIWNIWNR
jgi:hypothetical protein